MSSQVQAPRASALAPEHVRPKATDSAQPATPGGSSSLPAKRSSERTLRVVKPRIVRPKPRSGLPLVLYGIQQGVRVVPRVFGVEYHFTNPKLTKRDALQQEHDRLVDQLFVFAERRHRIISVMNSKGGAGKTPTCIYAAGIFKDVVKHDCLLIDINQNFGTVTTWAGINQSDTMQLGEAINDRHMLTSKDTLDRIAAHKQTGLRVIASEDVDAEHAKYTQDEFAELISNVASTNHSVFNDTGNGMSHPSNRAAIDKANAIIFAGLWGDPQTIKGIAGTMRGYVLRGHLKKIIEQSYVVINGTPPGVTKDRAYEVLIESVLQVIHPNPESITDPGERRKEGLKIMAHLGVTPDRFFIIPFSRYLKETKVMDVRPEVMGLEARTAYLRLLVAIYGTPLAFDPVLKGAHTRTLSTVLEELGRNNPDSTPSDS